MVSIRQVGTFWSLTTFFFLKFYWNRYRWHHCEQSAERSPWQVQFNMANKVLIAELPGLYMLATTFVKKHLEFQIQYNYRIKVNKSINIKLCSSMLVCITLPYVSMRNSQLLIINNLVECLIFNSASQRGVCSAGVFMWKSGQRRINRPLKLFDSSSWKQPVQNAASIII